MENINMTITELLNIIEEVANLSNNFIFNYKHDEINKTLKIEFTNDQFMEIDTSKLINDLN